MHEVASPERRLNDMPCTLNKAAWEKLIDEDIDWLDKQPDTLECKHIRQILEWTKTHRPDKQVERIKQLEEIYLGQIRVIARSRLTYKERVERMATLAEQALKA